MEIKNIQYKRSVIPEIKELVEEIRNYIVNS